MNLQDLPTDALLAELDRREKEDFEKFWGLFLQVTEKVLNSLSTASTAELTQEEYEFATQQGIETLYKKKGIEGQWKEGSGAIYFVENDRELAKINLAPPEA